MPPYQLVVGTAIWVLPKSKMILVHVFARQASDWPQQSRWLDEPTRLNNLESFRWTRPP